MIESTKDENAKYDHMKLVVQDRVSELNAKYPKESSEGIDQATSIVTGISSGTKINKKGEL